MKKRISVQPPEIFLRLCREYYRVEPEEILYGLAHQFAENPPRELIMVAQSSSRSNPRDASRNGQ